MRVGAGEAGEPDDVEQSRSTDSRCLRPIDPGASARRRHSGHGQPGEDRAPLEDHRVGRLLAVRTGQAKRPARWRSLEVGENPEECGLATTRRTDDDAELAGWDRQRRHRVMASIGPVGVRKPADSESAMTLRIPGPADRSAAQRGTGRSTAPRCASVAADRVIVDFLAQATHLRLVGSKSGQRGVDVVGVDEGGRVDVIIIFEVTALAEEGLKLSRSWRGRSRRRLVKDGCTD